MLANHIYAHFLLLLQPLVLWLSIATFNNYVKPPRAKWILRNFDVSWIQPRPAWLPHLEMFTLQNLTSAERVAWCGRLRYPPWRVTPRDQIKMTDYMGRRVTAPKWVTVPTWGPQPPCKQALKVSRVPFLQFQQINHSPFIIWVNLVPLESHFYDLISYYYFWT